MERVTKEDAQLVHRAHVELASVAEHVQWRVTRDGDERWTAVGDVLDTDGCRWLSSQVTVRADSRGYTVSTKLVSVHSQPAPTLREAWDRARAGMLDAVDYVTELLRLPR